MSSMFRYIRQMLVPLVILCAVGCTSAQKPDEANYDNGAKYAFDFANYQFAKKDWDYARSLFEKVQQEYPYSLYAAKSELRVADTHFEEKSFIRAASSYRRFIQLHPSHAKVDYAAYMIVKSYRELIPNNAFFLPPTWERDRRDARNAYIAAQQFLDAYADSKYADEVRRYLQESADQLASYQLYVAEYYMHRRHRSPIASVRRTKSMIEQYPESSLVPRALEIQVEAALAIDDVEQARSALERLQKSHPESDHTSSAESMMANYTPPEHAEGSDGSGEKSTHSKSQKGPEKSGG